MRRVPDRGHILVLLRICPGLDDELVIAGIHLLQVAHRLVVDGNHLDVARAGEIHDGRRRGRRAEREYLNVAVLHHVHRVGVRRLEVHPAERLIGHAVDLQHFAGQDFRGIALGLRDQRLALQIGKRIHLRVSQRDDLEILRIQVRDLANLGGLLRIGRATFDAIDGGRRIREADLRLAFIDSAHIGDAGAGLLLDLQPGNRRFPQVLQRAAQRNPRSALRAGHHRDLLGCGGHGKRGREHGRSNAADTIDVHCSSSRRRRRRWRRALLSGVDDCVAGESGGQAAQPRWVRGTRVN